MIIKIKDKNFQFEKFKNEKELESAVESLAIDIFGNNSVYLSIKKKIKNHNLNFASIPDGYLLDFRKNIKLWVVENELSTHDSFKHIGVQLLKFATQFTEGSFAIKEILAEKIENKKKIKEKVKFLSEKRGFQNISEALDYAIYKNEYGFVIIIDEITEDLTRVTREIARQPELLELKKYAFGGEVLYTFDEFLKELEEATSAKIKEEIEIDTIVCPAREEGFKSAFLEQKAWWAVRISSSVIPRLKYIAMYEVAPVSSIRWIGVIQSVKPFEDSGKYKINCTKTYKIEPIKLDNQKYAPQAPRYTKYSLIEDAKKLSDIF